jgi:hypothetical protein
MKSAGTRRFPGLPERDLPRPQHVSHAIRWPPAGGPERRTPCSSPGADDGGTGRLTCPWIIGDRPVDWKWAGIIGVRGKTSARRRARPRLQLRSSAASAGPAGGAHAVVQEASTASARWGRACAADNSAAAGAPHRVNGVTKQDGNTRVDRRGVIMKRARAHAERAASSSKHAGRRHGPPPPEFLMAATSSGRNRRHRHDAEPDQG